MPVSKHYCRRILLVLTVVLLVSYWRSAEPGATKKLRTGGPQLRSPAGKTGTPINSRIVGRPGAVINDPQGSGINDLSILTCLKEFSASRKHQELVDCIDQLNSAWTETSPAGQTGAAEQRPLIIAIVVHNRPEYYRLLLKSLERVYGIEKAIVVVSHDGYFPMMQHLTETIKFTNAKVKQLYHPYSASLPKQAVEMYAEPGQVAPLKSSIVIDSALHDQDSKARVKLSLLTGTDMQDSFMSDKHMTQTRPKHHYWWLWNMLYRHSAGGLEALDSASDYDGIFLEEDHYVTPDLITTFYRMRKLKETQCADCFAINLGHQLPKMSSEHVNANLNKFQYSVLSNIGMAISKTAFMDHIWAERKLFCEFNDYNWDLTMYRMEQTGEIPEKSLAPAVSRVYHMGKCGMHTLSEDCSADKTVSEVDSIVIKELEKSGQLTSGHDHIANEWLEQQFSKRQRFDGVEGWTYGKLWKERKDFKEPQVSLYIWESNINSEHCFRIGSDRGEP